MLGIVVGAVAGQALSWASRAGHLERGLLPVGTVAVPLMSYYGSVAMHGNGFVAAFTAGIAFAPSIAHRWARAARSAEPADESAGESADESLKLAAWAGTLLEYAVWCLFGVILVAHLGGIVTWQGAVFALLSLTLLRMAPVGLVLLGTGFARPTRLFIGWFGPRGLASVVFALIALEEYPDSGDVGLITGTIALTVLFSVVLHGITADIGADRYGAWAARTRPSAELGAAVEPVAGRGTARRRNTPAA